MPDDFQYDVFLSYSSCDKARVQGLAERLQREGVRVWFDDWIVKPGDDIYLEIEHGLEASRVLVLCLSPAALGSDWVGLERNAALFRDPRNQSRRLIPLLLSNCRLPSTLGRLKYVDYRQPSDAAFLSLLQAVRSGAPEAPNDRTDPSHIPVDVQRAVPTEASYECAACGQPCPPDEAHIIRWKDSQSPTVDNRIGLCANCRERAASEHWGEKTLRLYRERPWVLNSESPSDQPVRSRLVTLRLPVSFADFDETAKRIFIHSLAGFLGEPPESIKIVEVEPGSTIITVELSAEVASRLVHAIRVLDPALYVILGGAPTRHEAERHEQTLAVGGSRTTSHRKGTSEKSAAVPIPSITSHIVAMCADIFAPGFTIDIPFLMEQVWLRRQKDTPEELGVTEVYDLRIRNPIGNQPLRQLWVLFSSDHTERNEDGTLSPRIEVVPVTPDAYRGEMREYEWPFFGEPVFVDNGLTTIERTYVIDPPDPQGTNIKAFRGRVLHAAVRFPDGLMPVHQDLLAHSDIKKTLICLDLAQELGPGQEGWLRLKVGPTQVGQSASRTSLGRQFPTLFKQRLEVTCPLLVRDRLAFLLDKARTQRDARSLQELRTLVFTQGINKPHTGVRIADHRIAVIACDGVDLSDSTCTNAACYYGVIPLGGDNQTGLWWGCGSDRNVKRDVVHEAARVIDMLYYVGRPVENKEIARDLALSEKHEAFFALLQKMTDVGLLLARKENAGRVTLGLPDDLRDNTFEERMIKLREVCMQDKPEGTPQDRQYNELIRSAFTDVHPFKIEFRAAWWSSAR